MSSLDCCLPSTLEETQVGETGGVVNESFKETESVSSGSESSSSELESIFKATEQLSHFYIAEDQEDANDAPPKTRNEFLPEELPFIEETFPEITVDYEIRPLGRISTVVESFLVIESFEAEPVLDLGSLVVFEDRKPVGRVFDVFGPVKQPLYSIRLRPTDVELRESLGKSTFFVVEYSRFVDTNSAYIKGSDASWYNDEEVPLELQECSDDEYERKSSKTKSNEKSSTKKRTKASKNLESVNQSSTVEQQDYNVANPDNLGVTGVVEETGHFPIKTIPCLESFQVSKLTSSIPGLTRKSS